MAKKKTQPSEDKKPPVVKVDPFIQQLAVALKSSEILERADRAAHLLSDRDAKENRLDDERKAAKAEISTMETEIRRLSAEVREKVTMRDVDCERQYHYDSKLVKDVRKDTGEVFFERGMTEVECQQQFDFEEGGGKKSGDVDEEFGGGDEGGGEAAE